MDLYAGVLGNSDRVAYRLAEGRKGWVQIERGNVQLDGRSLTAGDEVAIEGPQGTAITSLRQSSRV